jgi:hypothetical protein
LGGDLLQLWTCGIAGLQDCRIAESMIDVPIQRIGLSTFRTPGLWPVTSSSANLIRARCAVTSFEDGSELTALVEQFGSQRVIAPLLRLTHAQPQLAFVGFVEHLTGLCRELGV